MPQIRYITSQSQIGAPGVYVLEQAPPVPTRGQTRRYAGFGGQCVRGPVGIPVLCTGYQRFLDVFGGRDKNSNGGTVIGHVWRALQGKTLGAFYVVRAAAAAAVAASFTLETAAGGGGTAVCTITASSVGTWGNDVQWKVLPATNADANYWNLAIKLYGVVTLFQNITTSNGLDNTNQVIGADYATLIKLTKIVDGRPVNNAATVDGADAAGYTKLGQTVAAFASVAGTDGAIADTDYTATGKTIDTLNAQRGIHACAIVGRMNTNIKTKIGGLTINQKEWFVCPDDQTISQATAITERATFNTDKMSYWFNHVQLLDPVTLEYIYEEPFLGPMTVITQTDPDVHVADFDNAEIYNYAVGVYATLADPDRDALDLAGVSFMNIDLDPSGNQVIIAGNGLTCDFNTNNRDLDARFMKNFLLEAIGNRLKGDQFKGNSKKARAARAASISGFLTGLALNSRYVNSDDNGTPLFSYVNGSAVNNAVNVQNGLQTEKLICQLIPKNKEILLLAVVGTNAVVTETAGV